MIALRGSRILPDKLVVLILENDFSGAAKAFPDTVAGRVINFALTENPDKEALLAYARVECTKMERGLFLLDTVIAVAPLIGLFGTVYGLFSLFPETGGLPDQETLTRGVGLALTTTMLGLFIAMPSLFANNLILRRIDVLAAKISLVVESLAGAETKGKQA
ncbi:MAG: MotA/TolQ/ExbB proton channel family protein [Opitutae bacterium]|nr:MotA/TolQ/ExbB proton channel family protein [Opitutae bacterium]MCD8298149.1 MotA/TolQ/ExbB proton channel family protein [Opitutae bacterium]